MIQMRGRFSPTWWIFIAVCCLVLLIFSVNFASRKSASGLDGDSCYDKLLKGKVICLKWIAVGDDRITSFLNGYYAAKGQGDEARKWVELSAIRGNCKGIHGAIAEASDRGDTTDESFWEKRFKHYGCTEAKVLENW
jgi:hypothetical protein